MASLKWFDYILSGETEWELTEKLHKLRTNMKNEKCEWFQNEAEHTVNYVSTYETSVQSCCFPVCRLFGNGVGDDDKRKFIAPTPWDPIKPDHIR